MKAKTIIFVFFGIDGCGKSTQAIALRDILEQSGEDVVYCWSRREPFLTKLPALVIKKLFMKEKGKSDGANYVSIKNKRTALFTNKWFRLLWIHLSLLDYFILIYCRVLWPSRRKSVLICDRFLHDALADFAVNGRIKIEEIWKNMLCRLFPVPNRIYFIDISAEVGQARKSDGTSLEYLQDRVPIYRKLALLSGAMLLDGNKPIPELHRLIEDDAKSVIARCD